MTCQRPGPFHGRCQPTADSSADLGLLARSSGVRPDVVHLHARRALAESQCPGGEPTAGHRLRDGRPDPRAGATGRDGHGPAPAHMGTGMQTGGTSRSSPSS